jgi:hypothetical protein
MKRTVTGMLLAGWLAAAATGAEAPPPGGPPAAPAAPAAERPGPGLGHRLLWYLPNRGLDLLDLFRLRLRVGPGLAVHVRATKYVNLYAGRYRTAFVGLPGPRLSPRVKWPWGLERERGLMFFGVDATDDLPDEPGYAPSEFVLGAQALLLGGEIGFDPVELGDFLAGFWLSDPRKDDR